MNGTPTLVTCGLPYTNGKCHIGHLRTYVPADFFVRYMRRAGEEVVFVCGSDNHGTPIVISAEQEGVTPRELSERYHRHFDETFRRMNVIFDHFGMTDDQVNHKRTQSIVNRLVRNGHIYPQTISQSYCPRCERFLPDRYVEGKCPYCGEIARGDECDQGCGQHLEPGQILEPVCKICGGKAELREQEHFFFRLGEFSGFLKDYLEGLEGTSNARNYARGWVREGLHDWCITRMLDWGVKFPGHDELVVYVWVDAPIGYISFTEEWAEKTGGSWKRLWCDGKVIHFIGGDITYHHCVFWPALLKGADYKPPAAVVASGMVKIDDRTFSKSRGYVVWTNEDYLDQGLPPDYLRYYLLAYTGHTKELNFSWKVFQERVNNELVGTLGNFFYRTLLLCQKEYGGVPDGKTSPAVMNEIRKCLDEVERQMKSYELKNAIDAMMALAGFGNSYISSKEPWKLVKTDPEAAKQVLRDCVQLVKALVLIMEPVIPGIASRGWSMLGYGDQVSSHLLAEALEEIGERALEKPKILFEKFDDDRCAMLEERLAMRVREAKEKERKTEEKNMEEISIEDFAGMELKVGMIISAEPIKKSDKLLKLMVDIGEEEKRQIVSGIAKFYSPDELAGMYVVVIANLKPAKLFGVESRGMILAAGDEASLLTPLKPVIPGTKIM